MLVSRVAAERLRTAAPPSSLPARSLATRAAEEDHEIMAEKNLEDHTISPESGISSYAVWEARNSETFLRVKASSSPMHEGTAKACGYVGQSL